MASPAGSAAERPRHAACPSTVGTGWPRCHCSIEPEPPTETTGCRAAFVGRFADVAAAQRRPRWHRHPHAEANQKPVGEADGSTRRRHAAAGRRSLARLTRRSSVVASRLPERRLGGGSPAERDRRRRPVGRSRVHVVRRLNAATRRACQPSWSAHRRRDASVPMLAAIAVAKYASRVSSRCDLTGRETRMRRSAPKPRRIAGTVGRRDRVADRASRPIRLGGLSPRAVTRRADRERSSPGRSASSPSDAPLTQSTVIAEDTSRRRSGIATSSAMVRDPVAARQGAGWTNSG